MAQWQRDPKARRNIAYLLAAVEVAAVTANFYPIFYAYLFQLNVRLSAGREELLMSLPKVYYLAVAATVVWGGVGVFVGVMFARDRAWARLVFIGGNVVLVALGVMWFVIDRLGARPEAMPAVAGLLLPIVTLFPLLWPLIVFRPVPARTIR